MSETTSLVDDHIAMLHEVADVLAKYEHGATVRLLFVPDGLEMAADEVLVQRVDVDRRVVELRPCPVSEVTLNDVVHASQVLDPTDSDFNGYAGSIQASSCLIRYGLRKNCIHIYD